MLNLGTVVGALTGSRPESSILDHPIADVVIDSRKASGKALFVALSGEHTDGHQFVQQSFAAGAVAADDDRPRFQRLKIKVGNVLRSRRLK